MVIASRIPLSISPLLLFVLAGCGPGVDSDSPADTGPEALVPLDPPADPGFQLHIGPFDVPVGTEVQSCYYINVPAETDVDVTRIEFAYTSGSHHVNVFRTEDPTYMHEDGSMTEDCWDAPDWTKVSLVANSQLEALDWVLPDTTAIPMGPASQLIVQIHYVNIDAGNQTTPTNEGEAYINFYAEPKGTRANPLGALFANNRSISLPPHEYSSFTASCMLPEGSNVIALSGHFHSRGQQFLIDRYTGATDTTEAVVGEEVYGSTQWDEPQFETYDVGDIVLGANEGLAYTCDFFNDTDETIVFGPHVETDEHCNMFGYYYPAAATSTYCF
jgi:hypothetical protein